MYLKRLTGLEERVIRLMAEGLTNKEIARRLGYGNRVKPVDNAWDRVRVKWGLEELVAGEGSSRRLVNKRVLAARMALTELEPGENLRVLGSAEQGATHPHGGQRDALRGETSRASDMKPRIEAFALGMPVILRDGLPVPMRDLVIKEAVETFFYLLCHGQVVAKNDILNAIWPNSSPYERREGFLEARSRLNTALYPGVIHDLEHPDPRTRPPDGGQYYRLDPKGRFWFDVTEFESLMRQVDRHERTSKERWVLLHRAIASYGGEFLLGFENKWGSELRWRLMKLFGKALDDLLAFDAILSTLPRVQS